MIAPPGRRDAVRGPGAGIVAVTYVITFDVRPGALGRFRALLGGVLDAMREEPTFHEAVLHADPASRHRFMLYETWESHEDVLNVQLRRPYRQAWHDALDDILAAPRGVSVWTPTRVDRRTA
jgi:(4S)-4-hydroxy-5-phosphonooxypentane-2,3-dione isomerase